MYHNGISIGITGTGIGLVLSGDVQTTGRHVGGVHQVASVVSHSAGFAVVSAYLVLAVLMLLVSVFFAARQLRARGRFGE